MIGSIVRIYLRSGKVFSGVVKEWNDKVIELLHNDEITKITNLKSIDAYTVNIKTKVDLKEDNEKTVIVQKTIEQKAEIAKSNALQDREKVREFLLSDSVSSEPTTYASQLSVLRQIKNNSKK